MKKVGQFEYEFVNDEDDLASAIRNSLRLSEAPRAEDSRSCSICRIELKSYIKLPNCSTLHPYCEDCAERLVTRKYTHGIHPYNEVTCVVCRKTNHVPGTVSDWLHSDNPERRVDYSSGNCPYHPAHALLYFCYDCLEPICVTCRSSGVAHTRHEVDSLDSALSKLQRKIDKLPVQLTQKRTKIAGYMEAVLVKKDHMAAQKDRKRTEVINEIHRLRLALDAKQQELLRNLDQMDENFQNQLDREVVWAENKLKQLDDSMRVVDNVREIIRPAPDANNLLLVAFDSVSKELEDVGELLDIEERTTVKHCVMSFPALSTANLNAMRWN